MLEELGYLKCIRPEIKEIIVCYHEKRLKNIAGNDWMS